MKHLIFKRLTVLSTAAAMSLSFAAPAFADQDPAAPAAAENEAQVAAIDSAIATEGEAGLEEGLILYVDKEFTAPSIQDHADPAEAEAVYAQAEGEAAPAEAVILQTGEAAAPVEVGFTAAGLASEAGPDQPGEKDAEPGATETEADAPAAETGSLKDSAVKVTVGGEVLGSDNNASNWNGTSGWHYTGGDVDTITLVNCSTVPDLIAEGTGFHISAAGLNHIGTLYADADVSITGTGILLIDAIDMLEGTQLNLLTNTEMYSDGSAAVFLKNAEDGCYYLINGSVPGILDDSYELPKGIHLVVPAGTSLDMRVLDHVVTIIMDDEGNETAREEHYGLQEGDVAAISNPFVKVEDGAGNTYSTSLQILFPTLVISQGSQLTIDSGAEVNMGTTEYHTLRVLKNEARIIVNGILDLFGRISGTRDRNEVPEVIVEGSGVITGSGVISQAIIDYGAEADSAAEQASQVNLGDGSCLILSGTAPAQITLVEGDASLLYTDGDEINDLVLPQNSDDASLTFHSTEGFSTLTVNGSISGSLDCVNETFHQIVSSTGALLLDAEYLTGITERRQLSPDGSEIQLALGEYVYNIIGSSMPSPSENAGKDFISFEKIIPLQGADRNTLTLVSGQAYSYASLMEQLDVSSQSYVSEVLRVYVAGENGIQAMILWPQSQDTISAESILGADLLHFNAEVNSMPGSSNVSVSGSNTGAGVLGGENAGVLTGGGATPVLPGSRPAPSTAPEPEAPADPAPTTPVDPQPEPPDTPEDTQPADPQPEPPEDPQPADPEESQPTPAAVNPGQIMRISGTGTSLHAEVLVNGVPLTELPGPVSVSFQTAVPAGWDKNTLFAVFESADGSLTVVKLGYNSATDSFTMLLPCTGDFRIICLDWAGTDYASAAFLAAVKAALAG